ncbi:MAG: hypothetical protein R3C97_11405 [Geminicoccaceae bacterium]
MAIEAIPLAVIGELRWRGRVSWARPREVSAAFLVWGPGADGAGLFPFAPMACIPAGSGFGNVRSVSFDNLTAGWFATVLLPAAALALLGLAVLLAHTVSRRWLERSDTAYAPFIAATFISALAWATMAAIRFAEVDPRVGELASWFVLPVGLTILFLWYRSTTATVWRALRKNPRGVWLLGISIRTATARAIGYALAATLVSGTVLAFHPALPLGFWVTLTASLTLAIWVGPLASMLTGPVLLTGYLFLPVAAGSALVGLGVVLLLALLGMLTRTEGELA